MTPAARYQAAIEVLDRIRDGVPSEKALVNWARSSRFAGSKDRAAVRDHVFDVVRQWRSTAIRGGGDSGRARVLGLLRAQGAELSEIFSGQGHAPKPLTEDELTSGALPEGNDALDLPDWIADRFRDSLQDQTAEVAAALQSRADVFLRVNLRKASLVDAQEKLAGDGILTEPHDLSATALRVTEGPRKVARSEAFLTGMVELQDVASQAVVDALPLSDGMRVLDYCAGGGGKTLAMAGRVKTAQFDAHDANYQRMSDLPERANRAGISVDRVTEIKGDYDLILCDVPCSGSGSWRRAPDGKWRFDEQDLNKILTIQSEILENCKHHVRRNGALAYATCSVLAEENSQQVARFLKNNPEWNCALCRQFLPVDGGDGFFVSVLKRV